MKRLEELSCDFLDHISVDDRFCIKKKWGSFRDGVGEVFVYDKLSNGDDFPAETVKLLYIKSGEMLSLHFHLKKTEIFYIVRGEIDLELLWNKKTENILLEEGDCVRVNPGMIHSMRGVGNNNVLLEVSTQDLTEDSYRIK